MKCCICGKEINGYGNNPWPLHTKDGQRCCDDCNWKVIAARVELAKEKTDANNSRKST